MDIQERQGHEQIEKVSRASSRRRCGDQVDWSRSVPRVGGRNPSRIAWAKMRTKAVLRHRAKNNNKSNETQRAKWHDRRLILYKLDGEPCAAIHRTYTLATIVARQQRTTRPSSTNSPKSACTRRSTAVKDVAVAERAQVLIHVQLSSPS